MKIMIVNSDNFEILKFEVPEDIKYEDLVLGYYNIFGDIEELVRFEEGVQNEPEKQD